MSLLKFTRALRLSRVPQVLSVRLGHSKPELSPEEFDASLVKYFSRPGIDSWELRQGLNQLHGIDVIPEPAIVIAALRAARRLNDYAITVRLLEAIKFKCGQHGKTIWPYMLQELKPTLDELGVETPEKMGYDRPELALLSVYDPYYFNKVDRTPK